MQASLAGHSHLLEGVVGGAGVGGTLTALAALAGCTSPSAGTLYSRNEARTAWRVSDGKVVDVKPVTIEGQKSWLGTAGLRNAN